MSTMSMSEPEPDDERDMDVDNAEKRAHHNALERKRRDHIKDSFNNLRDAVPILKEEKVVSRASILKKAADYLVFMRKENDRYTERIEETKRRTMVLEAQLAKLIEIKQNGLVEAEPSDLQIVYDETLENKPA